MVLKDKLWHIKNVVFISAKINLNRGVSSLADRKELYKELYKMEDFYRQKGGGGNKEIILAKKQVGYCKVTLL